MKHNGSIAPKERINILYQQAGDQQAQVELPLKILVMGNYGGQTESGLVEERKPLNITPHNFDKVMDQSELSLEIAVKDHLGPDPAAEMPLSLDFRRLDDFSPESIVNQCPQMAQLMALRQALTALKGPMGNIPAFRNRLRELLEDQKTRAQLMQEVNAIAAPANTPN